MWSVVIGRLHPKATKQEYETFMRITPCKECKGHASEEGIPGSYGMR